MTPRRRWLIAAPAMVATVLMAACGGEPTSPAVLNTTATVAPPQDTSPQVSAVREPPAGSAASTTSNVQTLTP